MIYKRIVLLFFITVLVLIGCTNDPMYNQTQSNVADVTQRSQDAMRASNALAKPIPSLVVNQGLYVDKTPVNLQRDPSWLKNHVIFRGDQLPFSYYSRAIVGGSGRNILTRYQVGLDPAVSVSVNYSGTVKGALDMLAAKTGYVYTVSGNNVYWQAFVTKTFDIAFMPGSSDYQMGKSSGATGGPTASSSSGGSNNNMVTSSLVDDSAAQQYSNLKGTLSIWDDLRNTVQQMLSADGKVMVSQATTAVTVRDRPTNVDLVGRYITNLNHRLSRQVLVKVQVLDVQLGSAYSYGVNWDVIKRMLGNNFTLNANYGTPISITNLAPFATTGTGLPQAGIQPTGISNGFGASGVTALINALNQQGKTSVVTEPRVVCLNNQVSVIRIVNQQGYVASIQNTTVAGAAGGSSNGTVTSQVTPGAVVTGLTLYILPKILDKKVYLQVNADLSNLVEMQNLTSSAVTTNTDPNVPVIQAPKLTQKQFNQRSVICSGDTLILSGFRQVQNIANAMQLFDSQALGGKAAVQSNSETIVLITPIILPGYA